MRKVTVYLPANGSLAVELEVSENTDDSDIIEEAYTRASLRDVEFEEWAIGNEEIINSD